MSYPPSMTAAVVSGSIQSGQYMHRKILVPSNLGKPLSFSIEAICGPNLSNTYGQMPNGFTVFYAFHDQWNTTTNYFGSSTSAGSTPLVPSDDNCTTTLVAATNTMSNPLNINGCTCLFAGSVNASCQYSQVASTTGYAPGSDTRVLAQVPTSFPQPYATYAVLELFLMPWLPSQALSFTVVISAITPGTALSIPQYVPEPSTSGGLSSVNISQIGGTSLSSSKLPTSIFDSTGAAITLANPLQTTGGGGSSSAGTAPNNPMYVFSVS